MKNGTSQNERMPEALDPESFKVDDRSVHDLIGKVQELAVVLAFYSPSFEENDGNRNSMQNAHNWLVIRHYLINTLKRISTEVRLVNTMSGINREFHKNRRTI